MISFARGTPPDRLRMKYTRILKSLIRKKRPFLHPKHGPRFYYKGNRGRNVGHITRRGGFVVDWKEKVPEFVVPDLEGCDLKPYVSRKMGLIKVPPPGMPDDIILEGKKRM